MEEDEEQIPITWPRSARKITHPSTYVAQRERGGNIPRENKEKKGKEPPTEEVWKKKIKLLSTALIATKKAKVYLAMSPILTNNFDLET